MYRVKVVSGFSAAHFLREYKGKCESLHGHNWKIEAVVASQDLDKLGLVIDFGELKKQLNEVLAEFDHVCINDLEFFKEHNPTSEYIAAYIFKKLKPRFSAPLVLDEIRVWEKDSSCATYRE